MCAWSMVCRCAPLCTRTPLRTPRRWRSHYRRRDEAYHCEMSTEQAKVCKWASKGGRLGENLFWFFFKCCSLLFSNSNRVPGLDSFRLVAAIIVMVYHVWAFPLFQGIEKTLLVKYLDGFYNVLWNGPAAVIVFFVISGFCIHFPYRNTRKYPKWILFSVKRILRLSIPFVAVLIIETTIKLDGVRVGNNLWYSIVGWSLTCELLYYLSYPMLYKFSKRYSWLQIFIISYTILQLISN